MAYINSDNAGSFCTEAVSLAWSKCGLLSSCISQFLRKLFSPIFKACPSYGMWLEHSRIWPESIARPHRKIYFASEGKQNIGGRKEDNAGQIQMRITNLTLSIPIYKYFYRALIVFWRLPSCVGCSPHEGHC